MENKSIKEAVILAGGKSSRMGQDKALLPFKGEDNLTLYQYNRLSKIFDKVYISSKNNKFNIDIPIIEDKIFDISSPMIALYSILLAIEGEAVFILGVDMPFVCKDIIETLISKYEENNNKIIVAKSPNGLEPLSAIYPVSILSIIKSLIDKNEHRLHTLISLVDKEILEFDDEKKFINLNKPSDYEMAKNLSN